MKKDFNDSLHTLALSEDGTYTAYSKEYEEHYHSTKDGALRESLFKHVLPTLSLTPEKEIFILDICYGLGFNTLATLLEVRKHFPHKKVSIYSPELDSTLLLSLENFTYPEEFKELKEIIVALSREGFYEDEQFYVEIYIGDAREYVRGFENKFHIVYQDAFSPSVNPALWTQEYFKDIANAMRAEAVLSTYSTALKTRLALYLNGFCIYLNEGEGFRSATLASKRRLREYKEIDMSHKIACNPQVLPLLDSLV